MTTDNLMTYFKFDEADLFANRNGDFSEAQKKKLYGRQGGAIREKRIAVAIGLPLSLLLLSWMAYLIYQSIFAGKRIDPTAPFFLGLCGFPMLLATLYIFRISFIHQKYLLKKAEGPINIIMAERHTSDNHYYKVYELHVGGMTFHAASELGNTMMQGDQYAVYYSMGEVNNFPEIQSVELISNAK